jgi:hypothetical protein
MAILPGGAVAIETIWLYVYELLAGNLDTGSKVVNGQTVLLPGEGSNPGGLLPLVATVGKSTWPRFGSLPYVGVDPPSMSLKQRYSAPRRDKLSLDLRIIAAVQVQSEGDTVINLEQAWEQLVPIIDDGEGNGVQPILRNDVLLGGNAIETYITSIRLLWDRAPAGGSSYIAWAELAYNVDVMAQAS